VTFTAPDRPNKAQLVQRRGWALRRRCRLHRAALLLQQGLQQPITHAPFAG
jgi:hypothetical protein